MSDKFIHDQVASFADSSSATQIETEEDCASSARSSSDAHEGRTAEIYSTQTKPRSTEGDAALSLGIIYDSRSDFQKAIECYEKSLDIAREEGQEKEEPVSILGPLTTPSVIFPKLSTIMKRV